jgi:CPA2 family monovalent cation:H+ antiporter-2
MDHEPLLISTIAVGLTAAFVGGLIARKLRVPPIVGYLLAGVAVGPFTPGLIADTDVAAELAEIGVVLLMFGVGIHFSIRDLLAVRSIAIPGAVGQIFVATMLGVATGVALGWGIGGGLVLGLALSVASTVVLLRNLTERRELDTNQGRIAVGWLIVEDVFTVVVLVLLPAIAPSLGGTPAGGGSAGPIADVAIALGKAAVFGVLMVVVGARLVPWLLVTVAREGSRELFTLAVLAIAVGIAFASSAVFGVSLALGAFLAGAIVGESDLSHQAAADALPLQDAFAVLFFVSVGMLVDPSFIVSHPLEILVVVGLIVVAKSAAAFGIVAMLGYPLRTALTIAAALAQIGEFSFILATLGMSLGLLPPEGFQLIVAGSLISITLSPLLFATIDPIDERLRDTGFVRAIIGRRGRHLSRLPEPAEADEPLVGHAVLSGYGRVGQMIEPALRRRGFTTVVISNDRRVVEALRREGGRALYGDASHRDVLAEAGVERARMVIAAVNDPHVTRLVIDRARELNPRIDVVARASSDAEAARLRAVGRAVQPVFGERELAVQMVRYAMRRFGVSANEAELMAQGLRRRGGPPSAPPPPQRLLETPAVVRRAVATIRARLPRAGTGDRPEAGSEPEIVKHIEMGSAAPPGAG